MEDMHTNASAGISRRTFISGSAIAGTLAALGLAGCAPKTGTEKEVPATGASTSDISWDEECEVLVVGSDYSGLAAAIEAKNAGADVKIIEKMNRVGGNSAFAAGDMAVCGSKVQAREGIEDSVDAFVSDMLIAGLYLNDEEKCRLIAEKSNETWEWSVEMGCTWDKDENGEPWLYPYGGHSILRTICQGVGGGSNVTGPLSEFGSPDSLPAVGPFQHLRNRWKLGIVVITSQTVAFTHRILRLDCSSASTSRFKLDHAPVHHVVFSSSCLATSIPGFRGCRFCPGQRSYELCGRARKGSPTERPTSCCCRSGPRCAVRERYAPHLPQHREELPKRAFTRARVHSSREIIELVAPLPLESGPSADERSPPDRPIPLLFFKRRFPRWATPPQGGFAISRLTWVRRRSARPMLAVPDTERPARRNQKRRIPWRTCTRTRAQASPAARSSRAAL